MKNIFENLNNLTLDSLDMSLSNHISNSEYQGYFVSMSSKEHYRLLTYLSSLFNGETFTDVGTLKGCSALALSTNKNNKVFSFNIVNQLDLGILPENVEFIIDDCINGKYDEVLLKSKIILLDTYHDGGYELQFLNHLKTIGYVGILLLDDIHLNKEMEHFWNNITEDKMDISTFGHHSGTGVVFLN